jgi:nucleoside-diphosphate-sugar epimerase
MGCSNITAPLPEHPQAAPESRRVTASRSAFLTGASGFIGTNLVSALLDSGWRVINFDSAPPLNPAHRPNHRHGSILDAAALLQALTDVQPDVVIHLAARTDCRDSMTIEDYAANTEGTRHLLEALKRAASVKRAIITSSQYVCGPGRLPASDTDYFPNTAYGASKVITEQLTRAANLPCPWVLIRPVNTWGPYHMRYAREFWEIVRRGWYFHPNLRSPVRCYGHVGNVTWQIQRLLDLPDAAVRGKVFYVGDRPAPIDRWVFEFHRAIRGAEPRVLPAAVMRCLAFLGDAIGAVTGQPFFLTSSRLRSMTQDYLVDNAETFRVLGEPPWTLEQGIRQTVDWLKREVWKS